MPDNSRYAAAGGFRFEFEQVRKIGQATTALEIQWVSRNVSGFEWKAFHDLKTALEGLRLLIAESRDDATQS